jgi:hypothetical protein
MAGRVFVHLAGLRAAIIYIGWLASDLGYNLPALDPERHVHCCHLFDTEQKLGLFTDFVCLDAHFYTFYEDALVYSCQSRPEERVD